MSGATGNPIDAFTIDRFMGVPYTAAPLLQCIFLGWFGVAKAALTTPLR